MAKLANRRTGSFFFKALGITLLFMAGFAEDIVQRETKYRSLDLLQKYYRTDEDAAGEVLFLENNADSEHVIPNLEKPNRKTTKRSTGKKQPAPNSTNNENLCRPTNTQPTTSTSHSLVPPNATLQTMPMPNN